MKFQHLKDRTKILGLSIIRLVESLPRSKTTDVIGRQLLRSATSVGANYRAACRARSPADFISKMGIVEEETDESIYWLELLSSLNMGSSVEINRLSKEADEILAITVSSIQTAKRNR